MCTNTDDTHRPLKEITPASQRKCTDVLWLMLWVAFWGFTFYLIAVGQKNGGDPERIVRGVDMQGRVCGVDDGVKHQELAAWAHPSVYKAKVCVSSCNQTETDTAHFALRRKSTKFIYYCLPASVSNGTLSFGSDFESDSATRSVGDLYTAWQVILASAFVALVIALLYTWFLKNCAGCLVWGCILITIFGGAFLSFVLLKAGIDADHSVSEDRAKALKWTGSIALIITGIFTAVILYLRKRISLAITVVKESGAVLGDICALVLFPVVPILLAIGYLSFWLYVALYLYSVGHNIDEVTPRVVLFDAVTGTRNENPGTMVVRKWDTGLKNLVYAHVFGLLWNMQFLVYFSYMVIAGTVADWYFSHTDEHDNKRRGNAKGELSNTPICDSLKRICRFHLGSIALGSLLIAIIQSIRAVLFYIQKHTAKNPNAVVRCLNSCVNCCLKCMQSFIDKVSKNSFVWTAIWGDSFCTATCQSFNLLWRNLARVAAINVVGVYLINLGKVTVTIVTTGLCALAFVSDPYYIAELNSPILPCLLIAFISYLVAALFMVVFETTMDTMFLCFLVDYEHNGAGHLMAPKRMRKLVEDHAQESATLAQERQELRMSAMTKNPSSYSSLASDPAPGPA